VVSKKIPYTAGTSTDAILESISDGVFTVDPQWRIASFNRAAERITGIGRKEALGKHCSEVFRSSMCEGACALRKTLENGKPVINQPCYIVDSDGRRSCATRPGMSSAVPKPSAISARLKRCVRSRPDAIIRAI